MRIVVVEGTPMELEQATPWLPKVIGEVESAGESGSPPGRQPSGAALSPAIERWFKERFPDPEDERRGWALQYLRKVWDLGPDVQIQPGRQSGGAREAKPYFFAKGSKGRAFLYFRPLSGVARFDLSKADAPDRRAVRVSGRRGYAVTVTIMDKESLDVAAELARIAYERNTGKRQ